jgi:hypothetical protein
MATKASLKDILGMRLRSQRIENSPRPGDSPHSGVTETVRHLLAVQAQDFAQALWAVGVRTPGSTRGDVLASLQRAEVVRSLPMRGTLHFVAAEDLGWMLSLTAERMLASAAGRLRALDIDPVTLGRSAEIVVTALAGGGRLGRTEFVTLLESNGISTVGQRGYHIIFVLCQRRLICWGPPSGTQQALVLLDEWVTTPRVFERDEALREFALRYFAGHGPATVRDFAWWTKLTLTDARAAIALAADELAELSNGDDSYWVASSQVDAAPASRSASAVHVLPGFDEYLLGYQDRSLPLAAEHSQRIVPGSNGIFLPLIVSKGRVIGTWRRTPKSPALKADYFSAPTAAERAGFARAAAAYAAFMGG